MVTITLASIYSSKYSYLDGANISFNLDNIQRFCKIMSCGFLKTLLWTRYYKNYWTSEESDISVLGWAFGSGQAFNFSSVCLSDSFMAKRLDQLSWFFHECSVLLGWALYVYSFFHFIFLTPYKWKWPPHHFSQCKLFF